MTDDILRLPRLGETMEDGVLVAWLVAPGQSFRRGEPLVEIETDKTLAEVPALADGTLIETLAPVGERLPVGTPIARIATAAAPATAEPPAGPTSKAPAAPPAPIATPQTAAVAHSRPRATPLARRLARAKGIDLAGISGTGRRGRIERRDIEAATAPTAANLHERAGLVWHEDGSAGGATLLLLHGFAADHAAWTGLSATLARAGARILAPDLPGHGRTRIEAATPDDLVSPLTTLLTSIPPGMPLHIVAHSLGAVPAVALAASAPTATLTLIAPAGLGPTIDAVFIRGLAGARSPGEVAHLLDRLTDGPNGLSAAAIARIAETLAKGRLAALADTLISAGVQRVNLRADLVRLAERMPVHLILGHRDRIIDWREPLDISPRIAVHHLPRAGHMPHWEALPDLAAILARIVGLPTIPGLPAQKET
jgi:pimeloyl-ACP methyl ester carboxylesterase